MNSATITITLNQELGNAVRSLVARGLYSSESEVVRAALRLLLEKDAEREARLGSLRADIGQGVHEAVNGQSSAVTADEFKARGRSRLQG